MGVVHQGSTAVLVPAAPRDDVGDTVESILHFEPDTLVVVINDSDRPIDVDGRAVILPPLPWPRNALGGLWCKDAYGLDWILQNSVASVVLRLDADALFVASGALARARQLFQETPKLGALGPFRVGPDGGQRSFTEAARIIERHCGLGGLRFPRGRSTLRKIRAKALAHGYEPGAHPLGAATFLRRGMLEVWQQSGWLQLWELAPTRIADDFLIGLLTYAAGFEIGDVGGPGGLVAARWQGLPFSPEEILAGEACITHSVRAYGDLTEAEIRRFFRERRAG